jgi:hypothetical protein
MKYGITKLTLGQNPFLDISPDEYREAKVARQNLMEVLDVEEKLNLVLENYVEFERELLSGSLNHMVFSDRDWSSSIGEIHLINRRLINLLTTCRLYMDQVPHNIKSIYGNDVLANAVKQEMSRQYDMNLGYRVLEALRNYVQHRSLPIQRLTHTASRQGEESGVRIRNIVTPSLDVNRLRADGKFKRSVLAELESIGNSVDVKPLVRGYIEAIGRIHLFIREMLTNDITIWESIVLRILDRYRKVSEREILSVAIVISDDSDKITESVMIFEDMIERRRWLRQKNQTLTHFSFHMITSEVEPPTPPNNSFNPTAS